MRVMRNVIYAALLLATALRAPEVAAQPVTQPKACQVTIARAPDDVRAVVETWVQSEPQCSVALEVRIVPTEGGLYLLAQDEHGRIRERIVPDAQTAGVLVASWIADDNAPPVYIPSPEPVTAPAAPIAPLETTESLTPPGLAPVSIVARAPAPPPRRSKWLTASAMLPIGESAGIGVRADVDVLRRGRWYFGAGLSLGGSEMPLMSSNGNGFIHTNDYKAVINIARPSQFGRWELRPAIGVGVMHTVGLASDGVSFFALDGTFTTIEASLLVSRELGKSWALYSGPLATVINQKYDVDSEYPRTLSRGNLDLVLLTGVRRRL